MHIHYHMRGVVALVEEDVLVFDQRVGGDVIVVAVELRDSDGVCFGTYEQLDVVVVQVEDLFLRSRGDT